MLRICLRQTLRKRNTVEEIGLCGQREVSENRVFADNMPSACVRADSDTLKQSLVYRHIVCLASVCTTEKAFPARGKAFIACS